MTHVYRVVTHVYRVVTYNQGSSYSLITYVEFSLFEFYQIQKPLYDLIILYKTSNTKECIVTVVFKGMYIQHQRDVEADSVNHRIAGIMISAEQSIN